jgi:hypothetical protein
MQHELLLDSAWIQACGYDGIRDLVNTDKEIFAGKI